MRKIFYLIIILALSNQIYGQNLDDLFQKIDLKLRKDKTYLNLHSFEFIPDQNMSSLLRSIPRTNERLPYEFQVKDGITYSIVFLYEGIGIDSPLVIYVREINNKSVSGEGLFGDGGGGVQIDSMTVLTFKDVYTLHKENKEYYDVLFRLVNAEIKQLEEFGSSPTSLLRITPDTEINTSLGMASRDNTDFLNFMRANNKHWYPKEVERQSGGRRGQTTTTPVSTSSFRLDAGLSSISFAHKAMDFDIGGASVEIDFKDKILNTLPYQSLSINPGFRILVSLSESVKDIKNSLVLDALLFARLRMNTSSINDISPGSTKPRLNTGNAGGLSLNITRPFGMPFYNFTVAASGASFSSPYVMLNNSKDGRHAYWNFVTGEATFSFYWNTSDKMTTRFRLDIGAGYFNVIKAYYNNNGSYRNKNEEVASTIHPVITGYLNFSPQSKEFYGGFIRWFDSQITMNAWLKLYEFSSGQLRFEATFMTAPIARPKNAWDNNGGGFGQIRYRHGF